MDAVFWDMVPFFASTLWSIKQKLLHAFNQPNVYRGERKRFALCINLHELMQTVPIDDNGFGTLFMTPLC